MNMFVMALGAIMAICAAIVQWLKDNKRNEPNSNGIFIFVVMGIVMACIGSILQKCDSDVSEKKALDANGRLQMTVDSTKDKIIRTLAEYGLEYDVKHNRIINILRDSIKTVNKTVINKGKPPTLAMIKLNGSLGLTLENNSAFTLTFLSRNATSDNVDAWISFGVSKDLKNFIHDGGKQMIKNETLVEGVEYTRRITRDSTINYRFYVFWCRGKYYGSDKTKSESFSEILIYDFAERSSATFSGEDKENTVNWFMKKEGLK
jgi:hypothetical protein